MVVEYVRSADEPSSAQLNTWNPWSLTISAGDERHIKEVKTVLRQCKLSDGIYSVKIAADPCNYDTQGRNGEMMMARARIQKGKVSLVDTHFGACEIEGIVTTKVIVSPRLTKPKVVTMPAEEYFQ